MTNPQHLAAMVTLRPELLKDGQPCPAWLEAADRECGKPATHGYLCKRHDTVAQRKLAKELERLKQEQEQRAARRAENLPKWRERLTQVESEMNQLDPPRPNDRAAYTGQVHPSITKKRLNNLSDSKVQKLAALAREHQDLTQKIGDK